MKKLLFCCSVRSGAGSSCNCVARLNCMKSLPIFKTLPLLACACAFLFLRPFLLLCHVFWRALGPCPLTASLPWGDTHTPGEEHKGLQRGRNANVMPELGLKFSDLFQFVRGPGTQPLLETKIARGAVRSSRATLSKSMSTNSPSLHLWCGNQPPGSH